VLVNGEERRNPNFQELDSDVIYRFYSLEVAGSIPDVVNF
jgi:hypothetical protein